MPFIFDATQPVSPERQKIAQALLQRKQQEAFMGGQTAQPQNMGQGLEALGQGIFDGLEARSLQSQAQAPTDAWADLRQVGTQQPTMGNVGGWGFGPAVLQNPFKRMFR